MGSEKQNRDQYSEKYLSRSSFSIRTYTPRSISRALTLSLIITITLVAMAGILSVYLYQMANVDKELNAKADAYLPHFINALEIPLLNVDTDTVKVIGKNISQDELVVYLLIKLDDGQEIFSYEDPGDGEQINRSSQIFHKDILVGYVEYAVTKELHQRERQNQLLLFCGATMLVLISLAAATGLYVRVFLKKPLDALNKMANSYAQGKPDLAIAEIPYYEFQQFGRVFTQMGATINKQLATLRKLNEELEHRVAERTAELVVAKEEAEASNQAKSDFLAHMSHEIRTPLNAITGLTNIVLKSELTDEQQDYLRKTQIASNNLLAVINDILDFSKVEAGKLELSHAPFDLDQILEKLADLFGDRVTLNDLELIFTMDRRIPRQLIGDVGRLSQVLTNLVANAVKFTEQGEIVVAVEIDDHVKTHSGKTPIKFRVSDTGVGIDPNTLPTLFDPFTQAEDYLTRRHEGTGLGLAICQRLVELMGGRIWAESSPGRGSTFSFSVALTSLKQEKPRFSLAAELHGLKVLVVDDSAIARQALVDLLESFNLNVSAVDSGEKSVTALEQAVNSNDPYQLVLLDWNMPDLNGIETAKRICEIEVKVPRMQFNAQDESASRHPVSSAHQPEGSIAVDRATGTDHPSPITGSFPSIIILSTAYGFEMLRKQTNKAMVDALLLKPVKPSQLFNTIIEIFDHVGDAGPSRTRKTAMQPTNRLSDRRILVVEDSTLNRDVVVALLEAAGIVAETAENGKEAVEKVTGAGTGYYDAVLMDIQMPIMDGYQATKEIRAYESKQAVSGIPLETHKPKPTVDIPIIALTAHALTGEKDKCLLGGMDDYITKPIDEKQLLQVLVKWILHHPVNTNSVYP